MMGMQVPRGCMVLDGLATPCRAWSGNRHGTRADPPQLASRFRVSVSGPGSDGHARTAKPGQAQ